MSDKSQPVETEKDRRKAQVLRPVRRSPRLPERVHIHWLALDPSPGFAAAESEAMSDAIDELLEAYEASSE